MRGGAKGMVDVQEGGKRVGYSGLVWDLIESRGGSWRQSQRQGEDE